MPYSFVGGGNGVDNCATKRVSVRGDGVCVPRVHHNRREDRHAGPALGRLFPSRLCNELYVRFNSPSRLG